MCVRSAVTHLVLHGNLGQISPSGSSGTAENNYAQCFTIVHVIVLLADNGEKSVLVFRVHFFLKLKNQNNEDALVPCTCEIRLLPAKPKKIVISSVFLYPRLIAKMSSGVLLSGTAIWEKG